MGLRRSSSGLGDPIHKYAQGPTGKIPISRRAYPPLEGIDNYWKEFKISKVQGYKPIDYTTLVMGGGFFWGGRYLGKRKNPSSVACSGAKIYFFVH